MSTGVHEYKLDMDDSFGDQALLTPLKKRISSTPYSDLGDRERWYIFTLQFLLWWSLSSIFDSIPSLLSIPDTDWISLLYFYSGENLLGAILYVVQIPRMNEKLRKFIGIVVICSGIWGCLTILTKAIQNGVGIHPMFIYSLTVVLTGSLGIFHHNMHRQDYLLDQLL